MRRFLSLLFVASVLLTAPGIPDATATTILFDRAHGERFLPDNDGDLHLSRFAAVLAQYHLDMVSASSPLTAENLAGVDAVVISGAFTSLSEAEVEVLSRFLQGGGRLAVMLHIGGPVAPLLHHLGVDVSNRPVHERQNLIQGDTLNFRVLDLQDHQIFAGLNHFSLYGGWGMINTGDNAHVIASTSPDAWVDLDGDGKLSNTDAVQRFGVVVAGKYGYGRFVIFGDDAIFQNKYLDEYNLKLAKNLAVWLGGTQPLPQDQDPMVRRSTESP